jgi:hypothetical protein
MPQWTKAENARSTRLPVADGQMLLWQSKTVSRTGYPFAAKNSATICQNDKFLLIYLCFKIGAGPQLCPVSICNLGDTR